MAKLLNLILRQLCSPALTPIFMEWQRTLVWSSGLVGGHSQISFDCFTFDVDMLGYENKTLPVGKMIYDFDLEYENLGKIKVYVIFTLKFIEFAKQQC